MTMDYLAIGLRHFRDSKRLFLIFLLVLPSGELT